MDIIKNQTINTISIFIFACFNLGGSLSIVLQSQEIFIGTNYMILIPILSLKAVMCARKNKYANYNTYQCIILSCCNHPYHTKIDYYHKASHYPLEHHTVHLQLRMLQHLQIPPGIYVQSPPGWLLYYCYVSSLFR